MAELAWNTRCERSERCVQDAANRRIRSCDTPAGIIAGCLNRFTPVGAPIPLFDDRGPQ